MYETEFTRVVEVERLKVVWIPITVQQYEALLSIGEWEQHGCGGSYVGTYATYRQNGGALPQLMVSGIPPDLPGVSLMAWPQKPPESSLLDEARVYFGVPEVHTITHTHD